MSQIQGVKKPLLHANSFSGPSLPKYGIETTHEEELGKVLCYPYCVGHIGVFIASAWAREKDYAVCTVILSLGNSVWRLHTPS